MATVLVVEDNDDVRDMTYAVLDLAGGTMTYARAGHTPLIFLPGPATSGAAQVLTPNGMIAGTAHSTTIRRRRGCDGSGEESSEGKAGVVTGVQNKSGREMSDLKPGASLRGD